MSRPTLNLGLLAALAAAQAALPVLPRLVRRASTEEEQARPPEGPLTPPPGAFAIWGPLFATSLAYLLVRLRGAARRETGMPDAFVALTFALNSLWTLNSQFRRLDVLSVALIGVAATSATIAVERSTAADPADRARAALVGPLAGWLTVATAANVEAAANVHRGRLRRAGETRRAVGLLAGASALLGVQARRNHGNLPFAAASGWGLAGILLKAGRERRAAVAAVALLGLAGLGTAVRSGRTSR